ncbi:MAG: PP2C family protein-serine/threonine phosphatase [Acidobacteriaceae bacterium]
MALIRGRKKKEDEKQRVKLEEIRITGWLNFVVLLAMAAVAYTDSVVVANISLGYLYVLPIALSAFINPLWVTVVLACASTVLQDVFGPSSDTPKVRVVRGVIALAGFLIVGFLVTRVAKQRDRLVEEVRRQRDEYEHDLILASQVQRQVLPKPLVCPALELAAAMQTAQLLGGDYYDFFQISEDVVDVVIADVSGHGAAASLLMPSLAVALRLRARELSGPAAIIQDLDRVLKQITNMATFVTMFYARFDQANRTLEYANGGHNPPLLLHSKTGKSLQLEGGGPIMGILPEPQFTNTVVALSQGDILTLFTDGVTEQENEAGDEFSIERLEEVVRSKETEPASALVSNITDAVSAFAGEKAQADDLTVVVVKVL